jgi:hypothetical protein
LSPGRQHPCHTHLSASTGVTTKHTAPSDAHSLQYSKNLAEAAAGGVTSHTKSTRSTCLHLLAAHRSPTTVRNMVGLEMTKKDLRLTPAGRSLDANVRQHTYGLCSVCGSVLTHSPSTTQTGQRKGRPALNRHLHPCHHESWEIPQIWLQSLHQHTLVRCRWG